ncbi:hypothetical protein BC938DRAFT_484123 [Jimgerdemannia flammicorona]|uniref:Programmed cell death protein 7 n=1 Tax=Jimgerdemannia flammicorona TaxID=994334 RepID=A0A433QAI7_9FUNG|nr:hypothetical protein BC938DRAFT_484123 [Jimgerdemannia flammicorona]
MNPTYPQQNRPYQFRPPPIPQPHQQYSFAPPPPSLQFPFPPQSTFQPLPFISQLPIQGPPPPWPPGVPPPFQPPQPPPTAQFTAASQFQPPSAKGGASSARSGVLSARSGVLSAVAEPPLSIDQLWLNDLLESKITATSSTVKLPNEGIVEARNKLWRATKLREQLGALVEELEENQRRYTIEHWKATVEKAEAAKKEMETILAQFAGPTALTELRRKLSKIRRHKKWQKKHIKKLQSVRDERERRRETLHKDIDDWRAEWIAMEAVRKQEEARKKEAEKVVQEAEANKNKHRDLTRLLEKVQKLRDLRREKMKREGHFFPGEDDEFFNRIRALNDALKLEEQRLDRATTEATETHLQQAIERERERELEREEQPRDAATGYWLQAELDLRALVAVRRQWDYFLTGAEDMEGSRIPGKWVEASPPANWVWASALVRAD